MKRIVFALVAAWAALCCQAGLPQDNLIVGGDFEQGLAGWSKPWSRSGEVAVEIDSAAKHGGRQAVRVKHTGAEDWSLPQEQRLKVAAGEIYELQGALRVEGEGAAELCVVLYDAEGKAIDWSFGGRGVRQQEGWQQVRSRFIIPPGAAEMWPRLIGSGPATIWMDDAALRRAGSLAEMRSRELPPTVTARGAAIEVTFNTADSTFAVKDTRTGQTWKQQPSATVVALEAKEVEGGLDLKLLDSAAMRNIEASVRIDGKRPEVSIELRGQGEMRDSLMFPGPFTTGAGTFLVMPVNEGISYPVDDKTLTPMHYHLYGGHGLCMGWYGVTDGRQGMMVLVDTPDDAGVRVVQVGGLLCLAPEWQPQKLEFGPPRTLRYVFFDDGGYVAMCKRYREHARQTGLLKTLKEKRAKNADVDRLVGAVNVWCWSGDPVEWCRELQNAGIERILWSNRAKPEQIAAMNEMNVLTSRYDIYQDVMNPANFPRLRGIHSDWTTAAWPEDLMIDANGDWIRGWQVRAKDGEMIPCGVLCDRQAVDYARERIPPELKTHPYRARFIDTTTASPWRECDDPDHPVTRSESRKYKMDLLRVVSEECGLVTGSETGHEAAVPVLHFFEGMMSLGPYRVPDAGRTMQQVLDDVPERVAKFQTGHYYRLPLWELVYHDCVVSYWYWGDYNNKLPPVWDRRDLINALYGTPPMFMFNAEVWRKYRDRFVESYKTAATIARATGYEEMLSHRWLTDDHSVQESRFANGVVVTVNFGDKPYRMADGTTLGPMSKHFAGL